MTLDVLWWFVSHNLLHNLMVRRLIVTEGLTCLIHINIPLHYIGGKVSLALHSPLTISYTTLTSHSFPLGYNAKQGLFSVE